MLNIRSLIIAISIVVAVPATGHAAIDAPDAVRTLAVEAAELVAEEQQLLILADPARSDSPTDLAEARARLRAVDVQASTILSQLDQLDVDLTEAARSALERLPRLEASTDIRNLIPPAVVYDAAIEDLLRIAATPDIQPIGTGGSSSGSFGLLLVAAGALVVLGLTALLNALRRNPINGELAAMAWSDGLTGLANRRRLDHDIAAPKNDHRSTSVIMIDVDHFKSVNDRFGHGCGDEILRRIGTVLSNQVRYDDVVYRYGGEEFCILLRGANVREARDAATRIVSAAHEVELPDGTHITVSVGVAEGVAEEVTSTIESADRALFAAKESGRDRAVTTDAAAGGSPPSATLTPA